MEVRLLAKGACLSGGGCRCCDRGAGVGLEAVHRHGYCPAADVEAEEFGSPLYDSVQPLVGQCQGRQGAALVDVHELCGCQV